jgi:hypothetical protein
MSDTKGAAMSDEKAATAARPAEFPPLEQSAAASGNNA